MITIGSAQLWVHDQQAALDFYTRKVGFEVRSDVTLPETRQLPLAVRRAGQSARRGDRADAHPRTAGHGRGDGRAGP